MSNFLSKILFFSTEKRETYFFGTRSLVFHFILSSFLHKSLNRSCFQDTLCLDFTDCIVVFIPDYLLFLSHESQSHLTLFFTFFIIISLSSVTGRLYFCHRTTFLYTLILCQRSSSSSFLLLKMISCCCFFFQEKNYIIQRFFFLAF